MKQLSQSDVVKLIQQETVGTLIHNGEFRTLYDYHCRKNEIDILDIAMDFYLLGRVLERKDGQKTEFTD